MKFTPIAIPERKRTIRSAYYDLVTAVIEAYREGKAIEVELASGDRFGFASIRAHLRPRLRDVNLPQLALAMKKTGPLTVTLWLVKKKEKP